MTWRKKSPCLEVYLALNASRISSSESVSFIFLAIMVRNSARCQHYSLVSDWHAEKWMRLPGKSIVPLLSASTSLIISCNSDSEGFWPRERMTVPSSLVVICPCEPVSLSLPSATSRVGKVVWVKSSSRSYRAYGPTVEGVKSSRNTNHRHLCPAHALVS